VHYGFVVEGRRVGHVHHRVRPRHRFGETLAGDGVDAERGEAQTASCPSPVRLAMTCGPMSQLPPITRIFMIEPC
jgi:hypothetical protein